MTVTAGSAANIDAQLEPGASISGKVTNSASAGIFNDSIYVYDLAGNVLWDFYAYTDSNGDYFLGGLPTDSYKVLFNRTGYYVAEWYNDKNSFADADPVAVTGGSTTPNIDAQLATGGRISGKITDTSAVGIQNIRVNVYDLNFHLLGSALTYASGNYTIYELPVGNYKICFNNNGQYYTSEWYNDKVDFNAADQVTVTAGSTTTNINAELADSSSVNGSISGKVSNSSGAGIQNIWVVIYNNSDESQVTSMKTDANGIYTITELPAATYRVEFQNNDLYYLSEWYSDKAYWSEADPVIVSRRVAPRLGSMPSFLMRVQSVVR